MNIAAVHAGDIVLCDVKGRVFHATVDAPAEAGTLPVTPLQRNVTWRHVTSRQVTEHWRKAGRPRANRKLAA